MILGCWREIFHPVIRPARVPTALTGTFSHPGDKCRSPLYEKKKKKSPAVPLEEFVTAATGCLTGCAERPRNGAPFPRDTLLFPVSPHFTPVISYTQKKIESKHLSRYCCRVERRRSAPPARWETKVCQTHARTLACTPR